MKSTNLEIYDVIMIEPSKHLDERGFFIGIPTEKYSNTKVNYLINKLLHIDKF